MLSIGSGYLSFFLFDFQLGLFSVIFHNGDVDVVLGNARAIFCLKGEEFGEPASLLAVGPIAQTAILVSIGLVPPLD